MQTCPLDIKPSILYQVAKAAWEGQLLERRGEICQIICQEFNDVPTRRQVANQIRIAMGLNPCSDDSFLDETDAEALMGLHSNAMITANPDIDCGCPEDDRACLKLCPVNAISHDEFNKVIIDNAKCLGEGHCVKACNFGVLSEKSQFVPLINLLKKQTHTVYASIAPAFAGQLGTNVTAGKLHSALLKLGFTTVVETALYADLVTMKEAFEFDHFIKTKSDFMITSCCCPIWIKLIENKFPELAKHISPSVSPMVASARVLKTFDANAKVVFIGPCIAKKAEIALPDLKGAVDFVLTFQELVAIFEATGIDPATEPEIPEGSRASWGGRLYGRTGGVSSAVDATLERLVPKRAFKLEPLKVDGIPDCQNTLVALKNGKLTANFIEGMACKGGCVGGPGRIISPEEGTAFVNTYSDEATAKTPVENPDVYALLARLDHNIDTAALKGKSAVAQLLSRSLLNK